LKIAHFTDIHVQKPESLAWKDLLSKRVLGWINLTVLRRRHMFSDAPEVLRALVDDLLSLRPDHIVSTGDFTALSLPAEFEVAGNILRPIVELPNSTGIPGNHDVYVSSAEKEKLYERVFAPWIRTDFSPRDFPEDLRHLHPYPLVRFLDENAVLICLRDVRPNRFHDSSGSVGTAQLRLLRFLLEDRRIAGRTKILALHVGFLRAPGRRDGRFHGLRDSRALIETAASGGVSLIVHGHTHERFVFGRGELTPVPVANPGSLASRKHHRAYHVYTVRPGGVIEVEARRLDPASGRFVPWPDAEGTGVIQA